VALTDKGATMRSMARSANALNTIHKLSTPLTPAEKAALRAANVANARLSGPDTPTEEQDRPVSSSAHEECHRIDSADRCRRLEVLHQHQHHV